MLALRACQVRSRYTPCANVLGMALDPALAIIASGVEDSAGWPRPLCPVCQAGHLQFGEPDTIEDFASYSVRDHEAWEPEWIRGRFTVAARCGNGKCAQSVHAVGTYYVDGASDMDPTADTYEYSSYYNVQYITPSLALMRLPSVAPEEVRQGLDRASSVIFVDPGLAATAVRTAVERFLTTQQIPAQDSSGNYVSLHRRIANWRSANPVQEGVADLLLAVKWIGNAGAHEAADVSVKDVLEGVELLDEAFHRLWVGPDIDARARAINAAKGPGRPTP